MVSRVVPHATTLGYFRYLYSGLVAAARCAECRCHPRKSAGSRGGGEKVPRRDQEYSSACFSAGRGAESSALVTPTSTFTITNINNQCRGSDLGVGSVLPLPAKTSNLPWDQLGIVKFKYKMVLSSRIYSEGEPSFKRS